MTLKNIWIYSRLILLTLSLFFFQSMLVGLPGLSGREATDQTNLTDNEKAWLTAHPIIRLAPDPEFKPIEFFDKDGFYKGIAADYTRLLEQKLGIKFEIIRCANWDEVIKRIKNREVDVLNAVVKTPQREIYLSFPQPYLKIPSVIIVRKNVTANLTLDMLKGMNLVMVSGYGYVDLIRNKYPGLNIELVPELKTALRKVSFGMADAFIGDLATTSFSLESEGITNLRLSGETEPPNISGFAVRSDWPELSSILEKGMILLTEDEKKAIFNKWIHLTVEPGMNMQEIQRYVLIIVCIISLLILCFLFFNRQLKRVVNLRTEDLRKEIEERKRTDEALRESETYLRTLIHTIPELVWLKDKDGMYLFCNSRFERFFGAKEEKIIGKTDYDFVDKKLADFFREHDKLAMTNASPTINEEEVTYADDGHHEILETIKTPLYDRNAKLIGVLGIARDITERKQAEEQRKKLEGQLRQSHKMESIGTLAGGIAHDFNNILSGIFGYSQLAQTNINDFKKVNNYIDQILKGAKRAAELVQQILTFSRQTEYKKNSFKIYYQVNEALKLLRSTIPTTIEIKKELVSRSMVLADPGKIHQVIMNLCTNAYHAMRKTGGRLKVSLMDVEIFKAKQLKNKNILPGNYLKLEVSDTGHGMDEETIEKAFDPYYTTNETGEGTGLGLAIVQAIVDEHDGYLEVLSTPGKGTTFYIYFPIVTDNLEIHDLNPKRPPSFVGNEKIMFVDDESPIRKIAKESLEKYGYKISLFKNGIEAQREFENRADQFDLIVTDMNMPGMAGDELSVKLKNTRNDIPIIICTGFSEVMNAEKAASIGINGFLLKPIVMKDPILKIREVLDKKVS